jgi:hypothetical protein
MLRESVFEWKMQQGKEKAAKALEDATLGALPRSHEEEEEVTVKFSMPFPLMGHVIGKVCIYIHTHIYIYIYTHIYIHTCTHTHTHTYPIPFSPPPLPLSF